MTFCRECAQWPMAGCAHIRVKWIERGISTLLGPRRTKALISEPALGSDAYSSPSNIAEDIAVPSQGRRFTGADLVSLASWGRSPTALRTDPKGPRLSPGRPVPLDCQGGIGRFRGLCRCSAFACVGGPPGRSPPSLAEGSLIPIVPQRYLASFPIRPVFG
jgi:hypothetical protein